ncbi:hypothetical protein [Microseira sp. BLCC-F43]|jgi:hypothetical protein|uniref:hypothetical protein n=1 Tax=Microseira sp. BLCC-F43 TaxID=3153602 RepID=UPI0035BB88AE
MRYSITEDGEDEEMEEDGKKLYPLGSTGGECRPANKMSESVSVLFFNNTDYS